MKSWLETIIREMKLEEAEKIKEIDRSERINLIFENSNKGLKEVRTDHECLTWNRSWSNY